MVTERGGKKRQGGRGGVEEKRKNLFFLKEFPGGSVVRTLGFQGQGSESNP